MNISFDFFSTRVDSTKCRFPPFADPDCASINLGIFICIKCAGVHRNLGVHISKVRSLDLDTACWDDEMIAHMRANGNVLSRAAFEKNAPKFHIRPAETDSSYVPKPCWFFSGRVLPPLPIHSHIPYTRPVFYSAPPA